MRTEPVYPPASLVMIEILATVRPFWAHEAVGCHPLLQPFPPQFKLLSRNFSLVEKLT